MILIIDNYDSFVYNIDRYLQRLGQQTEVYRNDAIEPHEILKRRYSAIILSPGPQTPNEAGNTLAIVQQCNEIPILGVCLGHQAIGQAFGGKVIRAPHPIHGQAVLAEHNGTGIFDSLPNPMQVARYHSLVVERESLPDCLEILATCEPDLVMALKHRSLPIWGVQFHPESIMTLGGFWLLANFLRLSGHTVSAPIPESDCTSTLQWNEENRSLDPWDEKPWWELP